MLTAEKYTKNTKYTKYKTRIFISLLILLLFTATHTVIQAAVPESTPAAVGNTQTPAEDEKNTADINEAETPGITETPGTTESTATATAASGSTSTGGATPHDSSKEKFDGTPDNTGNSGGQIAFMLIIFLVCLGFIIEAIVQWFRKKKKLDVRPEEDWRKR